MNACIGGTYNHAISFLLEVGKTLATIQKRNMIITINSRLSGKNMLFSLVLLISQLNSNQLVLCDRQANYAAIVKPQSVSSNLEASITRLRHYFETVTGRNIPIVSADSPAIKIEFHIVGDPNHPGTPFENHAFSISIEPSGKIRFSAHNDTGLDYAVSEFIERYLGVRWLMPTKIGTHTPKRSQLSVPIETIEQEPAFWGRTITGLHHPELGTWAKNLRVGGRIPFDHNLRNLIQPEEYVHLHPNFFPEIDGIRRLPAHNGIYRWQPCFSAPILTQEAISNIASYFDNNPKEAIYSLGINDSDKFCRCSTCSTSYPDKKNRYGYLNASNIYYHWVNRVAEGVLKVHPDKWFGLLAYLNCGDPPENMSLHPRVIPFITYDRAKWIVPKFRRQGHRLTEDFLDKAQYIGWYDYIYGSPYLLPRVYFHQMTQTYRYAADKDRIKFIYAEASPNFGEGPKLYIALKLFWNPSSDVDSLLKEWCELAVGREASKPLLKYYRHWEHFWTKRVKKSDWITEKGQWMWFGEPDYLKLVKTEEIAQSRAWLEEAHSRAITAPQKDRASILLRAFEYYEASAYSFWFFVEKRPGLVREPAFYKKMTQKRRQLVKDFESHPLLKQKFRFDQEGSVNLDLLNWATQ